VFILSYEKPFAKVLFTFKLIKYGQTEGKDLTQERVLVREYEAAGAT